MPVVSVIVVLPKIDDAKNIKNLLVRNGIAVSGAYTTGAQAIAQADSLDGGIILCGYKLADMLYSQLYEDIPIGFEMLLMASLQYISGGMVREGIMCISMPVKVHELVSTVDAMLLEIERKRRKLRSRPRERSAGDMDVIKRAKELLIEQNHMSEEQAYRYIQKCSMDSGTNMVETAQMVLAMMRG